MYKFYMAHCINEMMCRFRLNKEKKKDVMSLKERLSDAKNLFSDPASLGVGNH
jgi:hypothetical protein